MTTRTPHKHAKELRAFADGYEIQILVPGVSEVQWADCENPRWHDRHAFRVKPEPVPNKVTWHKVHSNGIVGGAYGHREDATHLALAPLILTILRLEIDHNNPTNPVLVSATLEKP